jgi:hypothetical protein
MDTAFNFRFHSWPTGKFLQVVLPCLSPDPASAAKITDFVTAAAAVRRRPDSVDSGKNVLEPPPHVKK